MKKSIKKEANITDLIKDWNENNEYFKGMVPNMNFNDFLAYCIEKFIIIPK